MRSSIASGRPRLPARGPLRAAVYARLRLGRLRLALATGALAVGAMFAVSPAAAQMLPPPQEEPRIDRLSDPRLAATAVDQVKRLLAEDNPEAALAEIARAGEAHPRRVELRFLEGVALGRLGRVDDAIATFEALTRDYPELGEPYNNLAVLHAGRDELDQARAALEQAIRVQPSYALARENLGDVLLRLARRQYEQAARSASTTATAARKLDLTDDLIRRITPDTPGGAAPSAAPATAPPTAPASPPAAPPRQP
jgi:Flp pilus assembly protein TadD